MRYLVSLFMGLLLSTGALVTSASADDHIEKDMAATFMRTTIVTTYDQLKPSVHFWREVMGYEFSVYPGWEFTADPAPFKGVTSPLGTDENSTTYFTMLTSEGGAQIGLLMIEDQPDLPTLDLPKNSAAYNGVVLVHIMKDMKALKALYDRAVEAGVEVLEGYDPTRQGSGKTIVIKAPTGHILEIFTEGD